MRWVLVLVAAGALAALGYARAAAPRRTRATLAALRAIAGGLIASVALGAATERRVARTPLVALDASASWRRASDASALARARDTARALAGAGGAVLRFGDSVRAARAGDAQLDVPNDGASRVADAVDAAERAGRPLVLVTDGEPDDADALARAPAGSRVVVVTPNRGPDVAVADVRTPATVFAGDTLPVVVRLVADRSGAPAARVRVALDGLPPVEVPAAALGASGETTVDVRIPVAADARPGQRVLRAMVRASGDREPRNDTLATVVEVGGAARAVFVSTSPDYDGGAVLAAMRATLAAPPRAYLLVAPGQWREAGSLSPTTERVVRQALAGAATVVLHGDTAALGAPRGLTRGALALVPVSPDAEAPVDWRVIPAPTLGTGPLAAELGAVRWDSVAAVAQPGAVDGALGGVGDRWVALRARPANGAPDRTVVAGGTFANARRLAVVALPGAWRWAQRGPDGARAFQAVWGGVLDWVGDAPTQPDRPLVVVDGIWRSGAPIRWRRGEGGPAATVPVVLRAMGPGGGSAPLAVRFAAGAREGESPSPAAGVYDIGGGALLAVNASAELLPRRPTVAGGPVGPPGGDPTTSEPIAPGWPIAVATVLLCAEWMLRRRLGLG